MSVDEVDRFARPGVGKVLLLVIGLGAAEDGIVGIVVGLVVGEVCTVDDIAEATSTLSAAGEHFTAQHGGNILPGMGSEVVAFVSESKKFVEATAIGMVRCRATQMPFADDSGDIASIL